MNGSILYTLGGILFNAVTAALAFWALPKGTDLEMLYFDNNLLLSLIAANGYLAIINLFPHQITLLGIRRPNDGLGIYMKITGKDDFSPDNKRSFAVMEFADLMEDGHYQKATHLTKRYLKDSPQDDLMKANLLVCYIKSGEMTQAKELSSQLQEDIQCKSNDEKSIIYNILAHYCILTGDIDKANELSRVAFSLNKLIREIRLTRGAVFIAKEVYDEGVALIEPYVDLNFKEQVDLEGAIYLTLGYRGLADKKKSNKYLNYLEKNIESMEVDTRILYDRHLPTLSGIKTMLDYSEILRNRDRNKSTPKQ